MCPFPRMVGEYYRSELQADFRRVQYLYTGRNPVC